MRKISSSTSRILSAIELNYLYSPFNVRTHILYLDSRCARVRFFGPGPSPGNFFFSGPSPDHDPGNFFFSGSSPGPDPGNFFSVVPVPSRSRSFFI
jgi:hypothetical protein